MPEGPDPCDDDQIYEFDKALPGESMDSFLRRHRAHPDDPTPRRANRAEEAMVDRTADFEDGGGFVLVPLPRPR